MHGSLGRVAAAIALSAALHTLVFAGAPAMLGGGTVREARQAALEVRLAAEAASPRPARSAAPPRSGSEVASGPRLGLVEGPRYLRGSELDSKPAPLTPINPTAPAEAAKTPGRVIARVLINERGRTDEVRIEASEPYAVFDAAVKAAFGSARYRPGMKDGRRVKSQMLVEVTFHGESVPKNSARGE